MAEAGARRPFFRRRKTCPFTGPECAEDRLQGFQALMRYVSERGKIVPSRINAVSAKKQRELRAPSSGSRSSVCCLTSFAKKNSSGPPRSRRG